MTWNFLAIQAVAEWSGTCWRRCSSQRSGEESLHDDATLLQSAPLHVISRRLASEAELRVFHLQDYIRYLKGRCGKMVLVARHEAEEEEAKEVKNSVEEEGPVRKARRTTDSSALPTASRLLPTLVNELDDFKRHTAKLMSTRLAEAEPLERDAEYGLDAGSSSAPVFSTAYHSSCLIAAGSIDAACAVIVKDSEATSSSRSSSDDDQSRRQRPPIALHWEGGRHHARRDEASGFCYFNDVVLAVMSMRRRLEELDDSEESNSRVLVIDIDVHHGDGTEAAFIADSQVMTLSLHQFGPGLFPGTGSMETVGLGDAAGTCVNLPFAAGADGSLVVPAFCEALRVAIEHFQPAAVVAVCGADGLRGDPLGALALTLQDLGTMVQAVLRLQLPTVLLGAGGYDLANAARAFALFTFLALSEDHEMPPSELAIPDDVTLLAAFRPSLRLLPPLSRLHLVTNSALPGIEDATFHQEEEVEGEAAVSLRSMSHVRAHLNRIALLLRGDDATASRDSDE